MSALLESIATYGWFGSDADQLVSISTYGWFGGGVIADGLFVELDGLFGDMWQ